MSFDNLMGYILSISMCMQNFITLFHSIQELAPFSLFQNLELGKASTISGLHHVNINVYAKFHHNIPLSSKDRSFFTFSEFGGSAKPRPTINVISQSPGLDLVNINVYAKVYQNILLSSRDRTIFTFSEFGARRSLDQ